jgi:hypothetical protein
MSHMSIPDLCTLTKSFFPYGERHGEESQEGEEDTEEEGQEEVVLETTHFLICGPQTSPRREQSTALGDECNTPRKFSRALTQVALHFGPVSHRGIVRSGDAS